MRHLERNEEYIEARWAESVGACYGCAHHHIRGRIVTTFKIYADKAALIRGGQPNPQQWGEW